MPYDGMTLSYRSTTTRTFMGEESRTNDFFTISYHVLQESHFQVNIRSNSSEQTLEVDADTRRYISEGSSGEYASHWIPTNLSEGDSVSLSPGLEYFVRSSHDTFDLERVEGGITVRVFRLVAGLSFIDQLGIVWDVSITRYYEAQTGLWVGRVTDATLSAVGANATIKEQTFLVANGIDTDGDSFTDLKELFVSRTNPLLTDTDSDLWNDNLDPLAIDFLIPDVSLAGGALAGALTYLLRLKLRSRKPFEQPSLLQEKQQFSPET